MKLLNRLLMYCPLHRISKALGLMGSHWHQRLLGVIVGLNTRILSMAWLCFNHSIVLDIPLAKAGNFPKPMRIVSRIHLCNILAIEDIISEWNKLLVRIISTIGLFGVHSPAIDELRVQLKVHI